MAVEQKLDTAAVQETDDLVDRTTSLFTETETVAI